MVTFGVMFSLLRTDRPAQRARHLLRQRNYINGGVTSFTIFIRDDNVHDAIRFGRNFHIKFRICLYDRCSIE